MLNRVVSSRWFALADLFLVIGSGLIWIFRPEIGALPIITIALIPWAVRILAGSIPFRGTLSDWLIVIFLVTAWMGYWAAYDRESAWNKAWLIVLAVLLYYALSTQPEENLDWICALLLCAGLGISIYYFLTHNFPDNSGKFARWWMNNRPQVGWSSIHHGYIAGLLFVTNLFAFYWLWFIRGKFFGTYSILLKILLFLGGGISLWVLVLTMTRGIWASIAGILGIWLLWKILTLKRFKIRSRIRSLFPILVLIYLSVIIGFVYLGPARAGGASPQNDYGENTRAELLGRGAYFLEDYPIIGGGLNSFPGLYSQYILVIPSYYFINSYNLFLDVSIEQGLIGGSILIMLYLGGVWNASRTIENTRLHRVRFFSWLTLFALVFTIIYSLFYDYLYNGYGTMLLLFPVGISLAGTKYINVAGYRDVQFSGALSLLNKSNLRIMFFIPIIVIVSVFAFNFDKARSIWFSNLGAVQMSQVELKNFPTNRWPETEILPALGSAETSLRSALQYDPFNKTANYRLGMIAMLRRDFDAAAHHLEVAYERLPNHRGVVKTLGYCYVWLGEVDKAQLLLTKIPEAKNELNIYSWWWGVQGRADLAEQASIMVPQLKSFSPSN